MKIHLIYLFLLILLLAVQESRGTCEGELATGCGSYCYKVVKPLLENTKILQDRLEDHENGMLSKYMEKQDNIELLIQSLSATQESLENKLKLLIKDVKPIRHDLHLLNENYGILHANDEKLNEIANDTQVKIEKLTELIANVDRRSYKKIVEKYYHFEHRLRLSWIEAKTACNQLGGHLLSLQSYEELKAVSALLTNYNYWTDINDKETEGKYVSASTGKPAAYLKWHEGQPNNYLNNEHCIVLLEKNSEYLMNDDTCSNLYNYICEKNV